MSLLIYKYYKIEHIWPIVDSLTHMQPLPPTFLSRPSRSAYLSLSIEFVFSLSWPKKKKKKTTDLTCKNPFAICGFTINTTPLSPTLTTYQVSKSTKVLILNTSICNFLRWSSLPLHPNQFRHHNLLIFFMGNPKLWFWQISRSQ